MCMFENMPGIPPSSLRNLSAVCVLFPNADLQGRKTPILLKHLLQLFALVIYL